jgi:hypothetical protein
MVVDEMNRKYWLCLAIAILGILVVVAAANAWAIYAKLWHWRHGNWIQCGNRAIPVPHDWFQAKSGHACDITAMEPEFHRHKGFAVARFCPRADAPSANDQQWRKDYASMLTKNGDSIGQFSELTVAGIPTVCVESNTPSNPDGLAIICSVSREMVITLNYNDRKWEADFYNMVRNMK